MEKKVVLSFLLRKEFHKVCSYTSSYINITRLVLEGDIGGLTLEVLNKIQDVGQQL